MEPLGSCTCVVMHTYLPKCTPTELAFARRHHQLLDGETGHRSAHGPGRSEHNSERCAAQESFEILCWEVMMFVLQILQVFKLAERFGMSVVWHAASSTVGHGFEITVASHRRIVLMLLLVAMARSPDGVLVGCV